MEIVRNCAITIYVYVNCTCRTELFLGTSLLCFYFYPLCYAAVLIKFTYYVCSRTKIVVRLCCSLCTILHEQFTTCSRKLYKTVLLECFKERYKYAIILSITFHVVIQYGQSLLAVCRTVKSIQLRIRTQARAN